MNESFEQPNFTPSEQEKALETEALRRLLGEFIRSASKVNEGNNGVIFRNVLEITKEDPEGQIERKDYAAKLLKIGNFDDLQSEYRNQKRAHEIIQEAIAGGQNPSDYALIPSVDYCEIIEVDNELADKLKSQGVAVRSEKVGVMMMDWVDGEDLAAHLFKEVITRENQRRASSGQAPVLLGNQPEFNQLHGAVAQLLDFRIPGGKGANAAERLAEKEKVEDQNEQRVYNFLKKDGYQLSAKVLAQMTNTINLLSEKGFVLWDNHLRNVMIDTHTEQAYLIDFAPRPRTVGEDYRDSDPRAIVRKLQYLTTSEEEDRQAAAQAESDSFMSEYIRVTQNQRWLKTYIEPFRQADLFLENLDYEISGSSDPSDIDRVAYALIYQMKTRLITIQQAMEFLDLMVAKTTNLPWRENALKSIIQKIKKAEI